MKVNWEKHQKLKSLAQAFAAIWKKIYAERNFFWNASVKDENVRTLRCCSATRFFPACWKRAFRRAVVPKLTRPDLFEST